MKNYIKDFLIDIFGLILILQGIFGYVNGQTDFVKWFCVTFGFFGLFILGRK